MRIVAPGILLAFGIAMAACQTTAPTPVRATEAATTDQIASGQTSTADGPTAVLWVKGLACPGCIINVERQLKAVEGVKHIKIDLASGRVDLVLSAGDPASRQQLRDAINESGFTLDRIEAP